MSENTHEFFLVALPGLEDLVQAECRDWFPEVEAKAEHGGVSVHMPLSQGLSLNLCLKTPTRILLRLKTFRCRDFPKLYQTVANYPWGELVDPSCSLKVHASTRLSRLKIKKRIESTCVKAWEEHQKKSKLKPRSGQLDLYVRLVNDDCTLSLDTSGERLHKRGRRTWVGEAPLRETIAAALIQMLGRLDPVEEIELVDPMVGSGTFLLEAAVRDQLIDAREFAFEHFKERPSKKPSLQTKRTRIRAFTGFERDTKTMAAAGENLKGLSATDLIAEDFFKARALPEAPRWLICNPPYNERLKVKEPLAELYARLFAKAEEVARPRLACFLLPAKAVKGKFPLPTGWKVLEKRPFLNGGIPVVAFVFARSEVDRSGV